MKPWCLPQRITYRLVVLLFTSVLLSIVDRPASATEARPTQSYPAAQFARVVQGRFDSSADQKLFQHALAKAFGGEVKIGNPGDNQGNSDGAANDQFGYSVALSGESALVGVHLDDIGVIADQGSAYVFTRSGSVWSQQAKLTAGDGAANDWFGYSVALSGDSALIGAEADDIGASGNQGSAYVFTRSGSVWSQQAKLTADDGAAGDVFGFAVALSGDSAIVGAYLDDVAAHGDRGSAYVFTRSGTTWSQQAHLTSGDGLAGDVFGYSVALSGDDALVGALLDDIGANGDQGSVYVFTRSGTLWSQQALLTADDGAVADFFGYAVALSGDSALVGAISDDVSGNGDQGSAYVFTRSGTAWSQQAKLTADDGTGNDQFGTAVALSGDSALVGAFLDDIGANGDQGSAYVFTRSGTVWSQQAQLTAADGAANAVFGRSVALSGDSALVGSQLDDIGANGDQGSAFAFTRSGTAWSQQARLTAGDGAANDWFGYAVALSGDSALVGANLDDIGANGDQGAAYVFTRSGTAWSQQAKLTAVDGAAGDSFGHAVALAGNSALVGAYADDIGANGNQGSVYVFTRSGTAWSQQAKLTTGDGAASDYFGYSVALSGDSALVGSVLDDVGANGDQGSAHVFTRSGTLWSEQAMLTAGDGAASDFFGYSVALSGDSAVVGARLDNVGANGDQGSAYVFTRSGTAWGQQAQLTAGDGAANDYFGYTVALFGDSAMVGAYADDIGANADQGSAYVFTRSGTLWSQQTKLTADDGAAGDQFGYSVALTGDTALVGAAADDIATNDSQGAAYVFSRNNTSWSQQEKLTASDGAAGDLFGYSVALSSDSALVGAYSDDSTGPFGNPDVGSVHVYDNRYAVTPVAAAHGAIEPPGVQSIRSGQTTSFVVIAETGYVVQAVSGCGGTWLGSNPYVTASIGVDCTVTATFAINQFTISFDSQGGGAVGTITQDFASTVTVPNGPTRTGYTFAGWNSAADGNGMNHAPATTFVMPANNLTLFAQWTINTYTLTYAAGANGSIDGSSPQLVNFAANGSAVTAVPDAGHHFAAWSDASTANPRTDTNIAANLSVTANFGNDAPSIASVPGLIMLEDSAVLSLLVTIADRETSAAALSLMANSAQTGLIAHPIVDAAANPDQRIVSFAPLPNQNGGPVTITLTVSDSAGASSQRGFTIQITPVNDAPNFTLASIAAHPAATTGVQTVNGFANVDLGPADEDVTQTVADFLIDSIADPNSIFAAGSLDIANNGTLTYEITGIGGAATISVRVRDNGGIANAGADTSLMQQFTINVTPGADLQVAKDNNRERLLDGEITVYAIVVANAGPNPVGAATVTDSLPPTLINGSWSCNQGLSTAVCPIPSANSGDLNATIALGVNDYLRFDVIAEVDGSAGAFVSNTVTAAPPNGITALNTGNDSATDQDPIVPSAIFASGFESATTHLTVPGADQALAR